MDRRHWDRISLAGQREDLGWFEPVPSTLELVAAHSAPPDGVIDVGGGDSALVNALSDRGYTDLTVLDLSPVALERCRGRLGDRGDGVTWIAADVVTFAPSRTWDLWHDRALFHFLVDPADRRGYVHTASQALSAGGHLVIATFAPDGPPRCAGLPVCRYDPASLLAEFGPGFRAIDHARIAAAGPIGDRRPYTAVVLARS